MQKKIFSVLAFVVGLLSPSNAFAGHNKLELQDVMLPLGNTEATLSVLLSNEDQIAGFQGDLYLPEGVEVARDGSGDCLIELARTTGNRHSVTSRLMADGSLRIVCTSTRNAKFSNHSGSVLNMTLKVKKGLAVGHYVMSLKNIVLTDPEATRLTSDDASANLIVVPPVTVTAKSYTREYGEANPKFGYTVEGAELNGEPEIVCEATATSPVGEYPIIIKKGGVRNYNDTYVDGTLTITKAPLTVSVGNYEREEGEKNPEFVLTYQGWKLDEDENVLLVTPTAETEATEESPVGTYPIVISGGKAQNYAFEYISGVLTVKPGTGIDMVQGSKYKVQDCIYDLQGRKIDLSKIPSGKLPKGIYIINGKKTLVK